MFRQELAAEDPYQASIRGMRLRLVELQAKDSQVRKIRAEKLGRNWEYSDKILHYQGLPYVPKIIRTELISKHHDDLLADHFGIEKTLELVARKYYWKILRHNVEVYIGGCDVCLAFKVVKHKPYGNLYQLLVPTHCWKDLSIEFLIGLPQFANWRGDNYDLILIIVDRLTKKVYYEPVQTTITAPALADIILNIVVQYYSLLKSIISNRGSVFISKFWFSLCYFLSIKRRLSTAFHSQTNGQTEWQNSTMEAYFRAFVNYK